MAGLLLLAAACGGPAAARGGATCCCSINFSNRKYCLERVLADILYQWKTIL